MHLRALVAAERERIKSADIAGRFQRSEWYRMFALLAEAADEPVERARLRPEPGPRGGPVILGDQARIAYLTPGPDAARVVERVVRRGQHSREPSRADALFYLAVRTASPQETQMAMHGHRTRGQVLEGSLWHRLAYHAYREHGDVQPAFAVRPDPDSGNHRVTVTLPGRGPVLAILVPRAAVRLLLRALIADAAGRHDLRVRGGLHRPLVDVAETAGGGLQAGLAVRIDEEVHAVPPQCYYEGMAYVPARAEWVELDGLGPMARALELRLDWWP
jgi:hypothetical protein